jgi:hypothetical protein
MQPSINTDHPRHDASLIAGLAAGDLTAPDRARAEALLVSCNACAELHHDLLTLQAAVRSVPAPATRFRDFQLTAEQARRLVRGSWLRGLLRPFAAAGSATRPLAAAFTSVGAAGLLIAMLLPGILGPVASAPAYDTTTGSSQGGGAAITVAPEANPDDNNQGVAQGSPVAPAIEVEPTGSDDPDKVRDLSFPPVPAPSDSIAVAAGGSTTGADAETGKGAGEPATRLNATSGPSAKPSLLVIGSLGLLLVGLSIFGLRFAARRVR